MKNLVACGCIPLLFCVRGTSGAEFGDRDGDGRVSLADVVHLREGLAPAPGSTQTQWPCFSGENSWQLPGAIYFESLRRNTASSIPNWSIAWPTAVQQAPLPPDPGITLELEPIHAAGGDTDTVDVVVQFHTTKLLKDFTIVLESEGDILLPYSPNSGGGSPTWTGQDWFSEFPQRRLRHESGDLSVYVLPQSYLVTGGKYVIGSTNSALFRAPIQPGDYRLVARARLPRGTRAGLHALRASAASELVLSDGVPVAPTLAGETTLEIAAEVKAGWGGTVPPISGDMDSRCIFGRVEFRLLGAEGFPGDAVTVKLQMRTETPLNSIYADVRWPRNTLLCEGVEHTLLRPDGEEPEIYAADRVVCGNGWAFAPPDAEDWVSLTGASINSETDTGNVLEYFQPLNAWLDVAEVRFIIPENLAGGTTIPLILQKVESPEDVGVGSTGLGVPRAMFMPFDRDIPCASSTDPIGGNWSYDISYEGTTVKVLGDQPGEDLPPEDLGVQFLLEDVQARPGQVVIMPVLASVEVPLTTLRLAVESDADLFVEAMEVEYFDNRDGSRFRSVVDRGEIKIHERCDDPAVPEARCTYSTPFIAVLEPNVEAHRALADFLLTGLDGGLPDWIGPELREVARLHIRIAATAEPRVTQLRPAKFVWQNDQTEVESGGFVTLQGYRFGPAESIDGGFITIAPQARFVRGDCNGDGRVAGQVADAVFLLNYNFLGGKPPVCLAACDANGDGRATGQVADAIYILQYNFLGGPPMPLPYPDCGLGTDLDVALGCVEEICP